MITIYTDGSSRGNPGPGGWGAIVALEDRVVELGGREEHTTNNRMELTAAIRALDFVSKLAAGSHKPEARIYTDSEYVMKGITEWIGRWQAKGWRTAAKKPVLNQDLWQELLRASEGQEVEWEYVAGHSGHAANDRCDEIATAFADLPRDARGAASIKLYNGPRSSYTLSL